MLGKIAAAALAVLLPKIYEIHPKPARIVILAIAVLIWFYASLRLTVILVYSYFAIVKSIVITIMISNLKVLGMMIV
jgi:hypothetical protein